MRGIYVALFLAVILSPHITMDYKKDVAVAKPREETAVGWSDSAKRAFPENDCKDTMVDGPLFRKIQSFRDYLKARNLEARADLDGSMELMYKIQ